MVKTPPRNCSLKISVHLSFQSVLGKEKDKIMPKEKNKKAKAEVKARKGPQRQAKDIEKAKAEAEKKAQEKAKAEVIKTTKAKVEEIGKRIYSLAHGALIDATYKLANIWLRVASGLELYLIVLLEEAKAEGLEGIRAEKVAKRHMEEFIRRTFDQNDKGNSPKNLQRQIDAYRWLKPILDGYWLQKDFDKDIEATLANNGYQKVLAYIRKSTVYDLSREFTTEEAKEIFNTWKVKVEELNTEHASERFILQHINAEAKAKAEKAKAEREEKARQKAEAEGKAPKVKKSDKTTESQSVVINLPDIPAKDIKHRGTYVMAYNRYLQGVCQFLTEARRSNLEALTDRALASEAFARLKAVNDVSEALLISIEKGLGREGYFIDIRDQFKVKPLSEKAVREAEEAKAKAEALIREEAEKKAKAKAEKKAKAKVANV
jgi:hypothetical protein